MSDKFNTELLLGGKIPKSKLQDLVDELDATGWYTQWAEAGSNQVLDELRDPENSNPQFTQQDTHLRGQDTLFDFLQENNIAYHFRISGNGVYDGEIQWWYPGYSAVKAAVSDTDALNAVVSSDTLRKLKDDGLTLDQVIEALEQMPPPLPKFVITDEQPI